MRVQFWPGPIVAASQKSAHGTKVVTTEEWPGPAAGVVSGHHCSALVTVLSPQTMPAILSHMTGGCDDRLSCYELERGSIFITGLMT